jgi:hypothetical protein
MPAHALVNPVDAVRPRPSGEVRASVSYIVPNGGKAFAYEYDPPAGTPRRSNTYREHVVNIRNARSLPSAPTLDTKGFELRPHATRVQAFYDTDEVRRVYYPEVAELVKQATGAASVVVFDHTVRGEQLATRSGTDVQEPVSRVHNDYTAESALRRAEDFVQASDWQRLLRHRIVEVNVWRPIRGPLQGKPLAVIDAGTVDPDDVVRCELIYRERRGEIYYLAHRPTHEWFYFPDMHREEALLIKGFDSDSSRARFAAHAAFTNPEAPPGALPRESIEVRTFAFFAPEEKPEPRPRLQEHMVRFG